MDPKHKRTAFIAAALAVIAIAFVIYTLASRDAPPTVPPEVQAASDAATKAIEEAQAAAPALPVDDETKPLGLQPATKRGQ
jgi:hypothetical protein